MAKASGTGRMKIQGSYARPASLRFDGSTLRMRRKRKGWTLKHLALRSGMAGSIICRMERGQVKNPSLNTIVRLSLSLGCTCENLCTKH